MFSFLLFALLFVAQNLESIARNTLYVYLHNKSVFCCNFWGGETFYSKYQNLKSLNFFDASHFLATITFLSPKTKKKSFGKRIFPAVAFLRLSDFILFFIDSEMK